MVDKNSLKQKDKENKEITLRIYVDKELIEILDKLKDKLDKMSYNALSNISYKDLTKLLAKKIKDSDLIY